MLFIFKALYRTCLHTRFLFLHVSPLASSVVCVRSVRVSLNVRHVDNESSMPIFLSYIRLSDNTGTDVRYQGHESRKDNVMQPS